MTISIIVEPGQMLVASVAFLVKAPLFVTIMGPAGVTFGSQWHTPPKEIRNDTDDVWQFFVQASHHGPIGIEVPVWVISRSGNSMVVGVGSMASPEAVLTVSVVPIP